MNEPVDLSSLGTPEQQKRAIEVINRIHLRIDELQMSVDAKYLSLVLLYRAGELFRSLLHHGVFTEEELGKIIGEFLTTVATPIDADKVPKVIAVPYGSTDTKQ